MVKKSNKPKEEPKAESEEKSEEVAEVKPEESEVPKEKSDEEESPPKFKNNGKDINIRLGTRDEPNWITVKAEEVVTIPRKIALANGLEEVK